MSDLTRDEIRRACEAVPGWEWQIGPDERGRGVQVDFSNRQGMRTVHRFSPSSNQERWYADALALLNAAIAADEDLYLTLEMDSLGTVVYAEYRGVQIYKDDDPIPAAAVRAVNAWAERKESR